MSALQIEFDPKNFTEKSDSMLAFEIDPIVRLWLLRMLVLLGAHKEFINIDSFKCDIVAESLGLTKYVDLSRDEFDQVAVKNDLKRLHLEAERKISSLNFSGVFKKNIDRLAKLVDLDYTDCRILEFAILIHIESMLDDVADWLGKLSTRKVYKALSVILRIPEKDVIKSLSVTGKLSKSGIITIDYNGDGHLRNKLDPLNNDFADTMASVDADPIQLLKSTVLLSSPGHLELKDYPYLNKELDVLIPYLKKSFDKSKKGVNVYIHGLPGTGKSQLVKAIAKELGLDLFEIAFEDSSGNPVDGQNRLKALRAGQSFFAQRKALFLFDEVEDVFENNKSPFSEQSIAQKHKAWMNRMLEENPIPVIWLSNSIFNIDPAFIRRFDIVFELPVPSKNQRKKIIKEHCGEIIGTTLIEDVSSIIELAPAVVTRTASVVSFIHDELGKGKSEKAFELLINNTLQSQGHEKISSFNKQKLPEVYSPELINTDVDIERIAEGMKHVKSGRLCLYGPPGTGKTAYGHWLSEQLEMPLLIKKGSDLISKWVGGTEKNIANAFQEAEEDNALLLIDEVDSFLQDRRGSQHSWELTEVNEMLTQMESFNGVFIASTNLIHGLDQAALRRFDMKIKFDFMNPEQLWILLVKYCDNLDLPEPDIKLRKLTDKIVNATPGDFAAIARRNRFSAFRAAHEIINALMEECSLKEGSKKCIGFT